MVSMRTCIGNNNVINRISAYSLLFCVISICLNQKLQQQTAGLFSTSSSPLLALVGLHVQVYNVT